MPTSRAVPQAEGWPVREKGLLPGVADLAGEQVQVVDQVVGPDATGVLVEAHGPERHHLGLRIGVQLGQRLEASSRRRRALAARSSVVVRHEVGELLEGHVPGHSPLSAFLACMLQRVSRAQAIADVGGALAELGVLVDEVLVHRATLDDVVGDVVEDQQDRSAV